MASSCTTWRFGRRTACERDDCDRASVGAGRGGGILDCVNEHLDTLRTTADAGRTLPSYGPAWDAAIEFGIDVTLLEHNLALSPSQRLQQLDEMLRLYFSVASVAR